MDKLNRWIETSEMWQAEKCDTQTVVMSDISRTLVRWEGELVRVLSSRYDCGAPKIKLLLSEATALSLLIALADVFGSGQDGWARGYTSHACEGEHITPAQAKSIKQALALFNGYTIGDE